MVSLGALSTHLHNKISLRLIKHNITKVSSLSLSNLDTLSALAAPHQRYIQGIISKCDTVMCFLPSFHPHIQISTVNITSCQFSSPQSSSTTQNPCLRGRTIESQPATPRSYHLVRLYGYDSTTYSTLPQTNAGAVPSLHAGIKYINPRLCIGKLGFSPSRRASLTILGRLCIPFT